MKAIATIATCLLFCSALAWGQANVDESLETAQLWVDANVGSDSNPGTQLLPLKTISKAASLAVTNNSNGIGTQVNINPGTYRESISISTSSQATSLPITFQAVTNGTVVVSGADVWTGWAAIGGQIYSLPWPYKWGLCPKQPDQRLYQDIILRREMIAVNGTVMTQVLSYAEMQAGTFYVDETLGTVYLWPPSGTNLNTATVEVATRGGLFLDSGLGNLVLRELTFQYDNSCRQNGAVIFSQNSSNFLIDTDTFIWNNAQGLDLAAGAVGGDSLVTVQNSVANHNGQTGFNATKTKYGLWQNDQTSYNNWRGGQGVSYSFGDGGTHFYQLHDETVTGLTALYNLSHALHFDHDNLNITVDSLIASGNVANALQFEKSEGPITVSNSYLCNNNPPVNYSSNVAGIMFQNSEFATLSGNMIVNPGLTGIQVAGIAGGFKITNWETGQVYDLVTQSLNFASNTVEGEGTTQQVFSDGLSGSDWTTFQSTLASDYNTWWNASNSHAFSVPITKPLTKLNFARWQTTMKTDAHSAWQAPSGSTSPCQVTPDQPDYWLLGSAQSQTVSPGGSAVFTVTLTSLNFTGTINLLSDVTSIPGATATLSPTSIINSGTSTFTVTTASSTPVGTYPVVVIANSGSVTRTITVSVVVTTGVSVSPTSLSFPSTPVGFFSAALKTTLSNYGSTTLTGISIAITGAQQGDFSQTNNCGSSLSVGTQCVISVIFSPQAVGSSSATLQITDSDPSSPQTVSLSGTGTAAPRFHP